MDLKVVIKTRGREIKKRKERERGDGDRTEWERKERGLRRRSGDLFFSDISMFNFQLVLVFEKSWQ